MERWRHWRVLAPIVKNDSSAETRADSNQGNYFYAYSLTRIKSGLRVARTLIVSGTIAR